MIWQKMRGNGGKEKNADSLTGIARCRDRGTNELSKRGLKRQRDGHWSKISPAWSGLEKREGVSYTMGKRYDN